MNLHVILVFPVNNIIVNVSKCNEGNESRPTRKKEDTTWRRLSLRTSTPHKSGNKMMRKKKKNKCPPLILFHNPKLHICNSSVVNCTLCSGQHGLGLNNNVSFLLVGVSWY